MSSDVLERIERELAAIRADINRAITKPDPGSVTFPGAARMLGVSSRTVARMVASRQLLTFTAAKTPRIAMSEIRRVMQAGSPSPSMPEGRRGPKPRPVARGRRGRTDPAAALARLKELRKKR